jgi:hypothetical protein
MILVAAVAWVSDDPGQADQTGNAGGCQKNWDPADRSFRKTTRCGISRLGGQAGTQAPDPTRPKRQDRGSRAGSTTHILPADSETIAAWQRLHGAAGQLRELDAAVQAAQWQAPVPPEHRQLLEAIPVNITPAAQVPPPEATVSDLCAGIISTAQRANQARRGLAARAAWSPELTADSMRHAAASYVVVSFNTETVYRALAERARQLGYHALAPGLDAAADHAD